MQEPQRAMQRERKVEFPFHYSPDKKLVHIVAKLENVPGALATLLNSLATRANMIGVTLYKIDGGVGIFSGFGEVLSESETADALRSLVKKSPSVLEAQAWESTGGLMVDRFHTGLRTGMGDPYIMLPTAVISEVFQKLYATFGSAGETILYHVGSDLGSEWLRTFRGIVGPDIASKQNELVHIFEVMGFGSSRIFQDRPGELLRLVVADCFECSKPTSNGHSCGFMRGLVAGAFGEVSQQKVRCQEIQCRFKGGDVCVFILTAV